MVSRIHRSAREQQILAGFWENTTYSPKKNPKELLNLSEGTTLRLLYMFRVASRQRREEGLGDLQTLNCDLGGVEQAA